MKKLLTLLLLLPLLFACGSDDDDNTQDYTSFTVMQNAIENQQNTVVGYKLADNTYKKIADLGDLKKGVASKEVKLTDNTIADIYIFTDYNNGVRLAKTFKLTKSTKNNIEIPNEIGGIGFTDKTDPTQYPQ